MSQVKIKICGLSRPEDIDFVNEARPDYCGFVIECPKSRRNVTAVQVRRLRERLEPGILPVGVFVNAPPEQVAELLQDDTLSVAQLHGSEDEAYLQRLHALAGEATLWKAFQVRCRADVMLAVKSNADNILLDSGQGSGLTFDWRLTAGLPRPFFLAGGLTPENIPQAIRQAQPFGVDISSGVESNGWKDRKKILAAVHAVQEI